MYMIMIQNCRRGVHMMDPWSRQGTNMFSILTRLPTQTRLLTIRRGMQSRDLNRIISLGHTEKSDYITKSCNVTELPGKSCWGTGFSLAGLYHMSCCCTGLQSMSSWRSNGTGLYHVILNDYDLLPRWLSRTDSYCVWVHLWSHNEVWKMNVIMILHP